MPRTASRWCAHRVSVGADYIEANEALSKKDFLMRIRISRKEAKECRYWLKLLDVDHCAELESEKERLIGESQELMNIFGAIVRKSETRTTRKLAEDSF